MSKVEKSDLTAGGDAPPIEATKIDCADNTVPVIDVKSTDVASEDAPGGEEVISPDAHTAEITNVIVEIAHAAAEDDVKRAEAQRSVEEANDSAIALQSEETTQSKYIQIGGGSAGEKIFWKPGPLSKKNRIISAR